MTRSEVQLTFTGYWFLENADESAKDKKWSPPEGLLEFIDGAHAKGKKVVYMCVQCYFLFESIAADG